MASGNVPIRFAANPWPTLRQPCPGGACMTDLPRTSGLRIAVTGSSGFVGRHLVRWLLRRGHRVCSLSRKPAGSAGANHRLLTDYLDVTALAAALAGCDVVVHLAARAHVLADTAITPDQAFQLANRDSAVAVATAARAAGLWRFVLISSIGVNGDRTGLWPFKADDPPAPAEPYAVSKWQAETAVAELMADSPTELVILRPTLVYGGDCPGNFKLLLGLVHRLPIVPLGCLRSPRSLIYVGNLCDAIAQAACHPGAAGGVFLVSDGMDLTIADVARTLALAFGKPSSRVWDVPKPLLRLLAAAVGKRQAFDKLAVALTVDIQKFRAATGWNPPFLPAEALTQTALGYLATRIP